MPQSWCSFPGLARDSNPGALWTLWALKVWMLIAVDPAGWWCDLDGESKLVDHSSWSLSVPRWRHNRWQSRILMYFVHKKWPWMFRVAFAQGGLSYGKDLTGVFRCILLTLAQLSVQIWHVGLDTRGCLSAWSTLTNSWTAKTWRRSAQQLFFETQLRCTVPTATPGHILGYQIPTRPGDIWREISSFRLDEVRLCMTNWAKTGASSWKRTSAGLVEQWVWPCLAPDAACCSMLQFTRRIRLQCGSVSLAPLVIATRTTIAPVWVSATPGNLWTVNICELQRWRTRAPTGGLTFCNTSRRRGCLENAFECWLTFPHTVIPQFLECHVTMSQNFTMIQVRTYCRPLMATVLVPKIEWSVNLQNSPKIVGNDWFPVKYPFRQSNDWL